LFLLFQLKAFSAVFVVTSNADSGPGTLRDALTQGNNTPGKNYISFNLPGTTLSDHTITLLSYLPVISTSIVIDGTTQPGRSFGVSDTRIRVINNFNYPAGGFSGVFHAHNCSDFEIYGIWITSAINTGYQASVYTARCDSVHVGAELKGNLIENSGPTLDSGKVCYFQHNICFSDTTGEVPGAGLMIISNIDKLVVGGSPTTGNMIAAGLDITFSNLAGNTLEVSYNKMGTNFYGTTAPYGFNVMSARLNIVGWGVVGNQLMNVPINGLIKNNIIADVYANYLLIIGGFTTKSKLLVQGNGFNTDLNGKYNFNTYSQGGTFAGILIGGPMTVVVGGDDPSQKNIIAYCTEGVQYNLGGETGKVLITKNSIYCYGDSAVYPQQAQPPSVAINSIGTSIINGTATPNSTIELYKADCSCTLPGPKDYFATVTADSKGNWSYNGAGNGYIMASATLDSLTGLFEGLQIDASKVITKNATCGTGSVTGIANQFKNQKITWYNSSNQIVATGTDLVNAVPDTYTLKVDFGNGCGLTGTYYILDYSIKLDTGNVKIIDPSCGNANGSISGVNVSNGEPGQNNIYWKDAAGKVWGRNSNLENVPAGNYYFSASNSNTACTQIYGPVTLKNTTGPNIDQSQQQIRSTNCGQATGSITNIQVSGGTGAYQYVWLNNQQQQVGTNQDLTGQPAGVYKLQVTDGGQCGPIYSTEITIPETNGITLDESKTTTTSASCNLSTGSITGIVVSGATQYQWVDANGKSYTTTTPDLTSVPAGTYILTASNGTGCSKSSQAYQIVQKPPIVFATGMDNSINIECTPLITASIMLTAPDPRMSSFRWVNSQNQTIGTGLTVTNLQPGTYQLYITDENGCENYYSSYVVPPYSPLAVTASTDIVNEKCGLKNGSIGAANITGGIPPYIYKWLDNSGTQIGTSSTIANLAAGNYRLDITNGACGHIIIGYVVGEDSEDLPPPSVSNVQLCSSGSALLSVNNASATTLYRLYDDANGTQPLAEQTGGRFNVTVAGNRSYFISQLNGTCESSRAEVKVTVGLSTLNIANTFTPNGDGINDYWEISNIENYPNATVQVFNRYGQKLFESKGYSKPFDGTYSGKKLAAGVYYYIINLSTNCNLLSGSLTILR